MKVGTIKEIWRYPVKSMGGECVPASQMEARGFADDRCWAVRDDDSGEFVGGRKIPKLLMLKARYLEEPRDGFGPAAQSRVAIEFPDGRRVNSDDPDVSAILSMFLGQRVSLCPRPAASDKRPHRLNKPMSPREIRYALGMKPDDPDPDFSSWSIPILATMAKYTTPPGALYDVYPLHFLTTAALETMRGHYPGGDFRVERYRPNFLIETNSDLFGIVENEWQGKDLRIGGARIRCNVPTIRCSMPGAAQAGMEKDANIPRAVMQHAHQHLGAYATPLDPAVIRAGDTVELIARERTRTAVWLGRLERKAKSSAIKLSGRFSDWQESRAPRPTIGQSAHPRGFRSFTLVEREAESPDIVSFSFADPERKTLPRYVPGQHVVVAIPREGGGFVYRPYTLSSAGADRARYRISVKRELIKAGELTRVGEGSGWLHDKLAVGDRLAIKDPGGQFADVPTDDTPLVMISAGIGITPFLAMLEAVAARNSQRSITLIHGVRHLRDFAFAAVLRNLQASLPNARVEVFVSQPESDHLPPDVQAGRMDVAEQLAKLQLPADSVYFLCGKPAFTEEVSKVLLAADIRAEQIRTESFGPSRNARHDDMTRYEITCTQSQRTLRWDPQHDNLLSFAEARYRGLLGVSHRSLSGL